MAADRRPRDGARAPSRFLSRLPRAPLARAVAVALFAAAANPSPSGGQGPARPWLAWRTIETPHFLVHYPPELEAWARDAAERLEGSWSAVRDMVGYAPTRKVEMVVDDPLGLPNGFAVPRLRRPAMQFWATPPSPRIEIGDSRSWSEMLAVHEFAHVAHLVRPSRSPWYRLRWAIMQSELGPITMNSPRWVIEGYATFVEGRITGTGRPNNAWRAAILRRFALEGRLPSYAALDVVGDYYAGSMAYLVGSAYLEWLAAQRGDSSLVHVWRRMTARQERGFDEAFAGVYGDDPASMYGRFVAEVTADAFAVERALARAGLDSGVTVQRLAGRTGDPAVSPDGEKIAIALNEPGRTPRLVVWKRVEEPDTNAERRRRRMLERDPQDVAAREVHPRPKKPEATLHPKAGTSFQSPRWLPDGRILAVRNVRQSDGTGRADLFTWDPERKRVRRVTRGAGIRDADPLPDGRSAVATRCGGGTCDLVHVDLQTGALRTIATGSFGGAFHRPRVSPDGSVAVLSVQREGRWRLAMVRLASGELSDVGPRDDANRVDPAWLSPNTIVVVSDAGGIANLERIDVASGAATTITRVTGAALGPEPLRESTGSLLFLSVGGRGYDLRRLDSATTRRASLAPLDSTLAIVLPPRTQPVRPELRTPVGAARGYGTGRRGFVFLPAGSMGADGGLATLTLNNTDLVGRLGFTLQASMGSPSAWRGGSVDAVWRGTRAHPRLAVFTAMQRPSETRAFTPVLTGLDVGLRGAHLSVERLLEGDGRELFARVGGAAMAQDGLADGAAHGERQVAYARLAAHRLTTGDQVAFQRTLELYGSAGRAPEGPWSRHLTTLRLAWSGTKSPGIDARGTHGRFYDRGVAMPFERFTVGGIPAPMVDGELLPQRIALPALPTGVAAGDDVLMYRVGLTGLLQPYTTGVSTVRTGGEWREWHRLWGVELAADIPPITMYGLPATGILLGVAKSIDAPFANTTRGYVSVMVRP